MRVVRDDGSTALLLKESADTSLVRGLSTGTRRYVRNDALEPVTDESPLLAAAAALPDPATPPLATIADPRALGLLVHVEATGPLPITALLNVDTLCESDLHGVTGELRAAGLLVETTIDGRDGYRTTDLANGALADLWD